MYKCDYNVADPAAPLIKKIQIKKRHCKTSDKSAQNLTTEVN